MVMTVAVLAITTLSLAVVLLAAQLSGNWVRATIETLAQTRMELRPLLVEVRAESDRAAALRRAVSDAQAPHHDLDRR